MEICTRFSVCSSTILFTSFSFKQFSVTVAVSFIGQSSNFASLRACSLPEYEIAHGDKTVPL